MAADMADLSADLRLWVGRDRTIVMGWLAAFCDASSVMPDGCADQRGFFARQFVKRCFAMSCVHSGACPLIRPPIPRKTLFNAIFARIRGGDDTVCARASWSCRTNRLVMSED